MRVMIVKVLLLFFFAAADAGEVSKRSPLEVGLVAFPAKIPIHHHNATKTGVPPVFMGIIKHSHTHKWIPGRVRHHSFIPAHLDHIYVPTHALLLSRTLETVFVHPAIINPYRQHYGGFGIGVDMGGHGAGHGFHVVFDF